MTALLAHSLKFAFEDDEGDGPSEQGDRMEEDGEMEEEEEGEWVTDDEGEEEQSFVEVNAKKLAPKVNLSDFELRRVIGKGAFGKVFLVRKIMGEDTGKMFAMKVLRKASLILLENKDKTRSERTILERLAHPFIVRLHYAFQTQGKLYLILQYASGGELFSYLQEDTLLEDTARFYLAELLLAIEHIHSLGIVYRDLKPENILLDGRGHLLLTDFGLSKVGLDESDGKTQTFCGTVDYMAPETLESQRYGKVVDWWSFGALMYDMLVGMPPFSGNSRSQTMDNIVQGKLTIPNYLSADAKDLIRRLLKKNPEGRLGFHGAEEIRRHPFFKKISWEDVRNLAATPPIVPSLAGEEDVKYFDPSFTTQPVVDTPDDGFFHLTDSSQELFKGFSYIGPSLLSPR